MPGLGDQHAVFDSDADPLIGQYEEKFDHQHQEQPKSGKRDRAGVIYRVHYEFKTDDSEESTPWGHGTFFPVVVNVNLTLKRSQDEMLIWVTDLLTGKPHADIPAGVWVI